MIGEDVGDGVGDVGMGALKLVQKRKGVARHKRQKMSSRMMSSRLVAASLETVSGPSPFGVVGDVGKADAATQGRYTNLR